MSSLRRARVTLFLALLLLLIAHAVPVQRVRIMDVVDRTLYMEESWVGVWNTLRMTFSGSIPILNAESIIQLVSVFLVIATAVLFLVLPFLVALLHRARPFLWITRLILIALVGFFVVSHIRTRIQLSSAASAKIQLDLLPGYWLLIASIVLYALGLFLIPRLTPKVARS